MIRQFVCVLIVLCAVAGQAGPSPLQTNVNVVRDWSSSSVETDALAIVFKDERNASALINVKTKVTTQVNF